MTASATPQAPDRPRSRRALLVGVFGGLAGLVGGRLAGPGPVAAAAGSPLIVGSEANNAGTSNTQLIANSNVVTFKLYQQGPGTALMGYTTTPTGTTRGVYGRVDSPNGDGVQGRSAGAAGTGAAIRAYGGNNVGVRATSDAGRAIVAESNGGNAVDATTTTGIAVSGYASTTGFSSTGVYGLVASANGSGVYGRSNGDGTTEGVYGDSFSVAGSGVHGYNPLGIGAFGQSSTGTGVFGIGFATSGTNFGVYGVSESPDGFAVYAGGNAHVTGTLSKSGGSFKIDHPLDPSNRYLQHSFVESPDMKNVYDGVATLGAGGQATIGLPSWFEALNRDFRYQLTPRGPTTSVIYVKDGVRDNTFTIAGGDPGLEVCWQITGIRQDAWAAANRIAVELEKPAEERGRYLHPELHGKPATLQVHPRPAASHGVKTRD